MRGTEPAKMNAISMTSPLSHGLLFFGGDSQLVPHHSLYPDLLVRGDYLDRPFKIFALKALVGENFPYLFLLKLGKSLCFILFASTMLLPELLLRLRP